MGIGVAGEPRAIGRVDGDADGDAAQVSRGPRSNTRQTTQYVLAVNMTRTTAPPISQSSTTAGPFSLRSIRMPGSQRHYLRARDASTRVEYQEIGRAHV